MAKDLPDYMREFDTSDDWGFTPVTSKPESNAVLPPDAPTTLLNIATVVSALAGHDTILLNISFILATVNVLEDPCCIPFKVISSATVTVIVAAVTVVAIVFYLFIYFLLSGVSKS